MGGGEERRKGGKEEMKWVIGGQAACERSGHWRSHW